MAIEKEEIPMNKYIVIDGGVSSPKAFFPVEFTVESKKVEKTTLA